MQEAPAPAPVVPSPSAERYLPLQAPAVFGQDGEAGFGAAEPVGVLAVLGAHGGAGTTTVAALLAPAWDLGVIHRPGSGSPPVRTGGRPLVLMARSTATAAGEAMAAVNALTWLGIKVAVLAVVGDGLPEPEVARYRYQLLAPRVGAIKRIPFAAALRATEHPVLADLPARARRAFTAVRAEALRAACTAPGEEL